MSLIAYRAYPALGHHRTDRLYSLARSSHPNQLLLQAHGFVGIAAFLAPDRLEFSHCSIQSTLPVSVLPLSLRVLYAHATHAPTYPRPFLIECLRATRIHQIPSPAQRKTTPGTLVELDPVVHDHVKAIPHLATAHQSKRPFSHFRDPRPPKHPGPSSKTGPI